jgi:hypothetical protein
MAAAVLLWHACANSARRPRSGNTLLTRLWHEVSNNMSSQTTHVVESQE